MWKRPKRFAFIKSLEINHFKVDTILLGGMGVKKNSKLFTIKLFNENISKIFTCNKIIQCCNCFCVLLMQNIQLFYGGPVVFVVIATSLCTDMLQKCVYKVVCVHFCGCSL